MRSASAESQKNRGVTRAAEVKSAASQARLRLWLRILKVSRMMEGDLREKLRVEFDTTLPRFDVLAALHRAERGLKMSELSGVLRVSNGNVTGIVDRLVVDGLIVRVPVEGDRRAMVVRLTAKGRSWFGKMAAIHEGWVNTLLKSIDGAQAEELSGLLGFITRSLQEGEGAAT